MNLCFLMEKEYIPYSKRFGTAFTKLKSAKTFLPIFEKIFQAKKWKCTKGEFVENINKFLDMKSLEPLIKYPEIKENRLLKFIDYCKLVE